MFMRMKNIYENMHECASRAGAALNFASQAQDDLVHYQYLYYGFIMRKHDYTDF